MFIESLEGRVLFTHAAHLHHLATLAHAHHVATLAHAATVAREAHHAATLAHAATVAREAHTAKHVKHLKHLAHEAHFLRTTVPAPLIMTAVERATWPTIRDSFLAHLKRIPK